MAFNIQETESLGGNFLIYGQEGSGKTNLGKRFPKPVIFRTEKGVNEKGGIYSDPKTYKELYDDLVDVFHNGMPYEAKSLIIDSVTKTETLINDAFCEMQGISELQDLGGKKMGGAYVWREAVMGMWNDFLNLLSAIQERHEINIVLIAHNKMKQEKRVDSDSYNMEDLDLMNPRAVEAIRRWSDVNAFIYKKIAVSNTTGNDKMKNNIARDIGGSNLIGLKRNAGFHAKLRDFGGRIDVENTPDSIEYDLSGKVFFDLFDPILSK